MAKMTLDDLVSQLRTAFGQGLHAVVLYGSQATTDHSVKSDYNILVLVESLDVSRLQAASAAAKAWAGVAVPQLRLSVELCAMYWHFLLLVWLVLLGLLTGWTDDFVAMCRQLLT